MELPESLVEMFGGKDAVFGMLANGPQSMKPLFKKGMVLEEIPAETGQSRTASPS